MNYDEWKLSHPTESDELCKYCDYEQIMENARGRYNEYEAAFTGENGDVDDDGNEIHPDKTEKDFEQEEYDNTQVCFRCHNMGASDERD
jgi:hypothetical protein